MNEFIENEIEVQKAILSTNIGEQEKYAIRYCILCLEDMLKQLDKMYMGVDGKLHEKTW